jgi:tetratricopeptide (TPR) repeat protein
VYYEQAVALDSTFIAAWAERARAYAVLYANGVPEPAIAKTALESAERARALGPERPEGYLALAEYHRNVTTNSTRALEQAQLGLKIAPTDVNLLVVAALAQQQLGRWEAASELLAKAQAVDPRSAATGYRLTRSLLFRRRYDEALAATDRSLQVDPTHLGVLQTRAMIFAARGDLAGARAAAHRAPPGVEPAAFVAYMANYYDLFWLLDESQRALLYQLKPADFDDDRGSWGLSLAGAYALQGDGTRARAYADSARAGLEDQLRATPDNAQLHSLLGVALAYLGRKNDAIREGRRGVELGPISQNAFAGPYLLHQLVRTYILVGEPEQALNQLEVLLKIPYILSPGWLRIDPAFDPLRKNPRFQKLAEATQ